MHAYVVTEHTCYMSSKQLEDGRWFVSVFDAPGVWGEGPTEEDAADECYAVWREWKEIL